MTISERLSYFDVNKIEDSNREGLWNSITFRWSHPWKGGCELLLLDKGEVLDPLEIAWSEIHLDKFLVHNIPLLPWSAHSLVSISKSEDATCLQPLKFSHFVGNIFGKVQLHVPESKNDDFDFARQQLW